ncbi:Metallo-dependent hydrolase [Favolaschia claudopus]|uniref:Metallo-dependent hydrolase n=1 Tax=Favolaschia claudopus TaxID=2862362 RepID=A0AAW0DB48_9AGAR
MANASSTLVITNVRLAHSDPAHTADLCTVVCSGGRVSSIRRLHSDGVPATFDIDAQGGLLLPSLCHSHIHLDKCFILDRCMLQTGYLPSPNNNFAEALQVTDAAKGSFNEEDLYNRGCKLVRESLECGVTSMRAHVEIDTTVHFMCLDVGVRLRKDFSHACDVQLAGNVELHFAQDPLFDGPNCQEPGSNFDLLAQAVETRDVRVVGSAPYVEPTVQQAKANIALILKLAQKHGCQVDFHLDYNLDPSSEPLIYEVISEAKKLSWSRESRITIGHATRLQLFTPTHDIYMLGRQDTDAPLGPPRSTLRIPYIANKYNIEMAMSINNVQNAFTPQGSLDPLSLCAFGVALFQSATPSDLGTLIRSVTLASKRAIGQENVPRDLCISPDDPADLVILHDTPNLQFAALNPGYDRTTIRAGRIVARRLSSKWHASPAM